MFNQSSAGHTRPPSRVTLTAVSETRVSESGKAYFVASFKAGIFGKPVSRTIWADLDDNGHATWPRVGPDDLRPLVGMDLTGEVEVIAAEIEPEEFVNSHTGEVHTVTSRSIVRFSDETLEQAVRRSGSRLRKATPAPLSPPVAVPASQALAIHGDGYVGGGGQVMPQVPA